MAKVIEETWEKKIKKYIFKVSSQVQESPRNLMSRKFFQTLFLLGLYFTPLLKAD